MLGARSRTESRTWRQGGPQALHFRERLDQVPSCYRQRYHFVSSHPGQPACSFGLRVGPPCYAVRGRQFGDNTAPLQFGCNRCPELRVPFRPRGQMIAGRKPVAFLAVAPVMRKHEVVALVHWIPSPRDEVIDVGGRWRMPNKKPEAMKISVPRLPRVISNGSAPATLRKSLKVTLDLLLSMWPSMGTRSGA
jgi:hypothetical protein